MNILFVIHTPGSAFSSVYLHYKELTRFLQERGHSATILCPDEIPQLGKYHAKWLAITYPFWVAKWIRQQPQVFDIISFHSYSGWVVNLLRRLFGAYRDANIITSFHGLESLYYEELKYEMSRSGHPLTLRFRAVHGFLLPRLIRLSCRLSDRVMCRNKAEAARLLADGWADERKLLLVPNSVPTQFFLERDYSREARRLLFVGQWRQMKGISDLVATFVTLAQQSPDLELWCAGTLAEEEDVKACFPAQLRERVTVRPRVSHDELVEIFRSADLFMFPSLSEGFGNALLEAMATGLPVVTTPAGAAPDILESGVSGIVVPRRDLHALAESVRGLLRDSEARKSMGTAGQLRARSYEMGRVHNFKLSLYEALIQEEALSFSTISNEVTKSCSGL